MAYAIYKYPFQPSNRQMIDLPVGAKLLRVGVQETVPAPNDDADAEITQQVVIWAQVNPHVVKIPVEFLSLPTGNLPDNIGLDQYDYLGTVQLRGSMLAEAVFHIYVHRNAPVTIA